MDLKPLALLLCVTLIGCQSIEAPQGTSDGYRTARFVVPREKAPTWSHLSMEDTPEFNRLVQTAIRSEFQNHGISVVQGDADLIIAYLLLRQGNVSTSRNQDYFGYGRDAQAIMDEAHRRGVIDSNRPDAFQDGAIVIDILDARTNKLIFRNFSKRGIVKDISDSARQERLNAAVAEALAPFFR